jgi:hypothetical protein
MTHRLALIAALLLAAPPAFASSALDGAWELQSGRFVDAQGKRVDYADLKLQGIKVLDAGTFAFTTTADGRFWAGGAGSYAVAADRYTETPRMASYPLEGDGHYEFHYALDGDTWTLERRDAGGTVVEREVWRRIEAAR